jgi:PKD repeat protein
MRIFLVVGILLLASNTSFAQCPVVNFALPNIVCSNQSFSIENTSAGTTLYEWDFCSGDLALTPTAAIATTNNLLFRTRSLRIVTSSNLWYGFTIDQANSPYRLIRFDFGNSLMNTPAVVDLGNPGNSLNSAFDLQMYQEGADWYALVANAGSNSLVRLSFGSDLQAVPLAQDLGSLGALNTPNGIFLVTENGLLTAFVTNGGTSTEIVRVSFGNSIVNTPSANSFPIQGGAALRGLSIIKECDRWFGLVSSFGNGKIFWLDFTNGLNQAPQTGEITFFSGFNFPTNIALALEGAEYFAFIQSGLGEQYRLSFGASILDKIGTGQNLGTFGISNENSALELIKVNSDWIGFSIDLANRRLVREIFPTACSASPAIYQGEHPPLIKYTTSGNKLITLKATAAGNVINALIKVVTVTANTAPDIDFTSANVCTASNVNFTSQNTSGGIVSYAWSFGDAAVSAQANPSHIYAQAGIYKVSVQVTAANGCANSSPTKDLTLFNQPVADFNLPAASPICTNQDYLFINQSTFDATSNPEWEWHVNGVLVSTMQDLVQQFISTTAQQIGLKAKIPGCENEMIKNISSVQTGSHPDFTFANSCQQVAVNFTNTTVDAGINYSWNFGEGTTTTQANPTNTFQNSGMFQVILMATNGVGCQNSKEKTITIYSKPQTNFAIELPPFSCAGSPSQFNDLTPTLIDSNITSWVWGFGDAANGTSSQKNPTYTYTQAGDYQVSLSATTNFGCTAAIQKQVTISTAPTVNFSNGIACLNQGTQFTDASDTTVKAWLWSMQNSSYTTKNPTHTFTATGLLPVMLTVTGNNNCVSQISKIITVPVPVVADFTASSTCADKPAVFQEKNAGGNDPAVSWSWDFAGQGLGTGSPAQHIFPVTGSYAVRMNSTRQSGCVYSITKTITISQPPRAQFTPSIEAGGSPLTVGFTNTSSLATSYLWKFNDASNSTSSEFSPAFTFNQLGQYPVELIASNALGCEDRFTKLIQVVVPGINASLTEFKLIPSGGSMKAMVTISNRGNIAINNPEVLIDLSGHASVKERLVGTIAPNQLLTRTLTLDIITNDLTYACAELTVAGDAYLFDNRQCINLKAEAIALQPYPNPAQDNLFIDWINPGSEFMRIVIYNASGQVVLEKKYEQVLDGLNQIQINVSNLGAGIYFVSYFDGIIWRSSRFSIVR